MGRVNVDRDRALFVSQVGWMARKMGEAGEVSLAEIVRWICTELSKDRGEEDPEDTREFRRQLLRLLRLDSQEQKAAEEHLEEILGQSFHARSPRWRTTDTPGREVDWTETYRRSLTNQPTQYVSREFDKKPDRELMGALRQQARKWADLLRTSGKKEHEDRAEKLEQARKQAIERNPEVRMRRTGTMTPPLLRRLRQKGPQAKKTSDALARVFVHQHTTPNEIVRTLDRSLETAEGWWNEEDAGKDSVWNRLLELSVLLAITQTADQSGTWTLRNLPDLQGTFKATLKHSTEPVTLTVGKETPWNDVFTGMRGHMGLADQVEPQDSQPDICLTFSHSETDASISVLGDAKRNATGSGQNYFRDGLRTATYYLSAFPHALGAEVVEATPWSEDNTEAFSGCIRPTVTLFFRQGVESESEGIKAVEKPANYSEIPPVLACDIEKHFGLDNGASDGEENDTNEDWSSSFLTRWLKCISEQAIEHLKKK